MLAIAMLEEVIKLLEGKRLRDVEAATGIGYQWLWRLKNRKVDSPNLATLEKLIAYLKPAA